MTIYVGDLIRLFGETDYHDVIGTSTLGTLRCYELSDGRIVSFASIEVVFQDDSDVGSIADNY